MGRGSLIALVPMWRQLRHASKEREKERQATLRRDVYLPAATQVGAMLNYMGSFASATSTAEERFREYAVTLAQMYVIGTDETLLAATRLDDYVTEAFSELGLDKIAQMNCAQELEGTQTRADMAIAEMNRWTEELRQCNLQGEYELGKGDVIDRNHKLAEEDFDRAQQELRCLIREHSSITCSLARKCLRHHEKARELLIPLMVAVRKELNTPFDEEAFRKLQRESCKRAQKNVDGFLASCQAMTDRKLEELAANEVAAKKKQPPQTGTT